MADEWWVAHGYIAGKEIDGGLWIVLAPMLFTWRMMICDPGSVHEFYCYPEDHFARAMEAIDRWDGTGDPIDRWVKHHPSHRRRTPA